MVKGKGKDNNMNLAEQVRSLQVSAGVFATAPSADGLTLIHLVVRIQRRCSGGICRGFVSLSFEKYCCSCNLTPSGLSLCFQSREVTF